MAISLSVHAFAMIHYVSHSYASLLGVQTTYQMKRVTFLGKGWVY